MNLTPNQEAKILEVLKANNVDIYTFEHYARYDLDLSRCWFNDFQAEIKDRSIVIHGNRGAEALYIFENRDVMLETHFKEWKLKKMLKSELFDLCEKLDLISWDRGETKQDLIDLLMGLDNEDYYKAYHNGTNWRDLEYDYSVTGYCQGDEFLVTLIGNKDSDNLKWITSDHLKNIYYDTPISIRIAVYLNGEEYDYLDISEEIDVYGMYDRKHIIDLCREKKHLEYCNDLIDYLECHLPNSLEYV